LGSCKEAVSELSNLHLCGINSRYKLPTRLIRITPPGKKLTLQLCPSSNLSSGTTYSTLSHCWGSQPFFTLTKRRQASFQRSIPVNRLTRTFREAMEVARRFRITFIWIESLCINMINHKLTYCRVKGDVLGSASQKAKSGSLSEHSKSLFTESYISNS
jgi:hypothetical protein